MKFIVGNCKTSPDLRHSTTRQYEYVCVIGLHCSRNCALWPSISTESEMQLLGFLFFFFFFFFIAVSQNSTLFDLGVNFRLHPLLAKLGAVLIALHLNNLFPFCRMDFRLLHSNKNTDLSVSDHRTAKTSLCPEI